MARADWRARDNFDEHSRPSRADFDCSTPARRWQPDLHRPGPKARRRLGHCPDAVRRWWRPALWRNSLPTLLARPAYASDRCRRATLATLVIGFSPSTPAATATTIVPRPRSATVVASVPPPFIVNGRRTDAPHLYFVRGAPNPTLAVSGPGRGLARTVGWHACPGANRHRRD
jgi:hypothetical protein